MSKTNSGLVTYAKAQVGLPYWYGCYGQTATAALYASKKAQYPSYYTDTDYASQYGKRVHDCTGLIKGYLWSESETSTPKYNSSQDKNATGMYASATRKGEIASIPGNAGILVFKGSSILSLTHLGVYGGDGYVYEAKGHAYGVRQTLYSASDWICWAQHPDITDDTCSTATVDTGTSNSTETISTTVTASESAQNYDSSVAGTYKVTASSGLNVRDGAGKSKPILTAIAKDASVKNYGYYTEVGSVKWLYIQFTQSGVKYTGFASGAYLSKA